MTLTAFAHKVTQPFNHVILQDLVVNLNHYISTTTVPMVIKHGRMVTYLDEHLPVKSNDPLITWYY